MGKEIEKKFLIYENGKNYSTSFFHKLEKNISESGKKIKQGYLPVEKGLEIAGKLGLEPDFKPSEARLRDKSGVYYFTLKGKGGLVRNELEKKIDKSLFLDYWPFSRGKRVEKERFEIPYKNLTLELDKYTDRDLAVLEAELESSERAELLPGFGKDITEDRRYKNVNLAG